MRTLEQVTEEVTVGRSECCTQTIKEALESGKLTVPLTASEIEAILRAEELKAIKYNIPMLATIKALVAAQKVIR